MSPIIDSVQTKLIRVFGWSIPTISPIRRDHVTRRLEQRVTRDNGSPRTEDLVQFLDVEATRIELVQRRRYDAAAIRANLPVAHYGEAYLRGWRTIRNYDSHKGSLECWLWGFIPMLEKEDRRKTVEIISDWNIAESIKENRVQTTTSLREDTAYDEFFDEIRADLAGFDWVNEICGKLALSEPRIRAFRTVLMTKSEKAQRVIKSVFHDGMMRDKVARIEGFEGRAGVDQIIARFKSELRKQLRGENSQ